MLCLTEKEYVPGHQNLSLCKASGQKLLLCQLGMVMEDITKHPVKLLEKPEVTATVKVVTMVSEPVGKGQRVVHYGGVKKRQETRGTANRQTAGGMAVCYT